MVLRQQNRIKPLYIVEDKVILLEFLYYKITPSKTHADPDDLCEGCADSAAIVNIHKLATYWLP